jgi:hypothetical protein
VADVPSGLSLTPPQETKKLKKMQQIGVSTSTAQNICHDKFCSRTKCRCPPLQEDGIARSCAFAKEHGALLENNPGVLNVIRFSDKAHPLLHGYINKQKCPTLSLRECKAYTDGNAWCALWRIGISVPCSSMTHSRLRCIPQPAE